MSFFNKSNNTNKALYESAIAENNNKPKAKTDDEWILVEGYKGTDKDMKCRDFQYELGKEYRILDGDVEVCEKGFHLCLELKHVFRYYGISSGNRFFRVRALVKKSDFDNYYLNPLKPYNSYKLAAKSIIFLSELTVDEVLSGTAIEGLDDKYKQLAINSCVCDARMLYETDTLVSDGYSDTFAKFLAKNNKFSIAHAVGSQNDISMDMKAFAIFNG